jgi:SAM-dependent methyltransferase
MHQPFLDQLQNQAEQHHVKKQIHPLKMSMTDLKFEPASFDLIWSEGAIYIMGFQNGLENWKPFIKPGGYLAVSELCWVKDNPPQEVKTYWEEDYPGMKSNQENLKIIEQVGYTILDHFFLPENSWWDHYYKPIQERLNLLRPQYADQPEAMKMLDSSQREIDIFKNYFGWYSYAFYILQK